MKQENLVKEKEITLFLKYAIPSMLAMMGVSFYILADTYFIANGIGSTALAALNIALPIYSFVSGTAIFIGVGGATLFSIYKGKEEIKELNTVFSASLLHTFLISIVFVLVGLFLSEEIALLLGASPNTFQYVNTYLKVILVFSPFMLFNTVLIQFIRNDGKPKLAMIAMLLGTILNVVLDYLFIYTFSLGMFGASFATAISPILSLILVISYLKKKKGPFILKKFTYSFSLLKAITGCGIASFIGEISSGIVIFSFNLALLQLSGEVGVAAYGIITNIALVVMCLFTGLAQGMQPIISVNFGANEPKRVQKIVGFGLTLAILLGSIFYGIGYYFPEEITAIFNGQNTSELVPITVEGIRLYFIAFLLMGSNIVMISFYQSTLKAKYAFILSSLRGFVLILILLLLLTTFLGQIGVWLVVPFTELIVFLTWGITFIGSFLKITSYK